MMAHQIADHLKQIFSEYGWPETLISDNGPCYASETFKKLMKEYNVNHVTSSPHYPQSNGLARQICPNSEKSISQSQRRGARLTQMSYDIQKHTFVKHFPIPNANALEQNNQIRSTTVNSGQTTNGFMHQPSNK